MMPNAFSVHQFPDERKNIILIRGFLYFIHGDIFQHEFFHNEQKRIYVVKRSWSEILSVQLRKYSWKSHLKSQLLMHTERSSHLECLTELIALIIWRDGEKFFSLLNQQRDQRCGKKCWNLFNYESVLQPANEHELCCYKQVYKEANLKCGKLVNSLSIIQHQSTRWERKIFAIKSIRKM